jgi:hypothetical protein
MLPPDNLFDSGKFFADQLRQSLILDDGLRHLGQFNINIDIVSIGS